MRSLACVSLLSAILMIEIGIFAFLFNGDYYRKESAETGEGEERRRERRTTERGEESPKAPFGIEEEELLRRAVDAALSDRRNEARDSFLADLSRIIEKKLGHVLSLVDLKRIEKTNREYFAALDVIEEGGALTADVNGIGAANQARMNVLGQIVGSESEANRILAALLNELAEARTKGGADAGVKGME